MRPRRTSSPAIIDQWEKLKEFDAYQPFYDRLKKYFGYMNTGFQGKNYEVFAYNGGLFKPDEVLDGLTISDDVLKNYCKKIADYDVIFLGYPIWYGTYANPIVTLVKAEDFAGKTIVPFCTFGSGGLNTSAADLEKALPKAKIKKGYGVRAARVTKAEKELNRFLIENGFKKGSVEKLADFSEQKPVTDADKALFDEACSSYQMPLGTPKTVGKRATAEGTDYKFSVVGRGMDGKEATSIIYVTVEKGAKAEFTEVVR